MKGFECLAAGGRSLIGPPFRRVDCYVSNTRIILHGTTYATANVTSVRKHVVPPNHLMLATAGGERSGLWSKDEGLVDRVAAAITDAFVHRG